MVDWQYMANSGYHAEIFPVFECAACAPFGAYSPEAIRKDTSGRLAHEMSFCPLSKHITTDSTSADIVQTMSDVGDGYLSMNDLCPSLESGAFKANTSSSLVDPYNLVTAIMEDKVIEVRLAEGTNKRNE